MSTPEELARGAGSHYYPVELSSVLQEVCTREATYALVGLPCALQAVHLALRQDARLRPRVKLLLGLVCGHGKSRAFAEYLIRLLGLRVPDVRAVRFRDKAAAQSATDARFVALDSAGHWHASPSPGPAAAAWPAGLFQPRACTFCDDLFAEVADVTLMDAWLPQYLHDPRGASLALVRSPVVDQVLHAGAASGHLDLAPLHITDVIASQAGALRGKRELLAHRLWLADRRGVSRPRTRVAPRRPHPLDALLRQAEEAVRATSHQAMAEQAEASPLGLDTYHARMRAPLRHLARLRSLQPSVILAYGRAAVRAARLRRKSG